jgi:hypothetical protein
VLEIRQIQSLESRTLAGTRRRELVDDLVGRDAKIFARFVGLANEDLFLAISVRHEKCGSAWASNGSLQLSISRQRALALSELNRRG